MTVGLQHHLWLSRHPGNQPGDCNRSCGGSTVTVTTASGNTINSGVHLSAGGAQPSGISAGYFGNGASNPNINGSVFVDNAANISARAGTGIAAFHFGYGNLSIIDRTGTSVSGAQFGISVGSSVSGTASPSNMSINVEGNATVMAGSLYGLAAIYCQQSDRREHLDLNRFG